MSSLEDPNDYECSDLEIKTYRLLRDTFLNKGRKYDLIDSVIRNDVDRLKDILISSNWFQVCDKDGNNLLQIAIITNNKDVFNYLLSMNDFPLETCNKDSQTALLLALTSFVNNDFDNVEVDEYFAIELLKKDVHLPNLSLHCAARRNFVQVGKLLLEKGVDPNGRNPYGGTPLHEALDSFSLGFEFEALLIAYGCDPLIEDDNQYTGFELVLHHPGKTEFVESLCFYTLDERTHLKMHLSVLLNLAQTKSPLFHAIVNQVVEVAIDQLAVLDYYMLFFIDDEYLKVLVEKCGFLMIYILMASSNIEQLIPFSVSTQTTIQTLAHFVEKQFNMEMIDFVTSLNSNSLFGSATHTKLKEAELSETICYLLSYGMTLNELDLQMIYKNYGYCKLLKMLLFMDFQIGVKNRYAFGISVIPIQKCIMPIFIYDIHMNLQVYLDDPAKYPITSLDHLMCFFTSVRLKNFCCSMLDRKVRCKADTLPDVPLLAQLARDAFRKAIIEKFRFKTANEFYTFLHWLPINNFYKKILNYEKKLY